MPEGKVIGFPLRTVTDRMSDRMPPATVAQASLFADPASNRGRIAFVDIGKLTEEPLLRLLTLNGVTAIVDLRPCPVFERPRFRHKNVVFYLHDRGIHYVEYALVVRRARERTIAAMEASAAYAAIGPVLERGMSLCLYDARAKELGWVDDLRRVLRHSPTFSAELHPRALDGMPA